MTTQVSLVALRSLYVTHIVSGLNMIASASEVGSSIALVEQWNEERQMILDISLMTSDVEFGQMAVQIVKDTIEQLDKISETLSTSDHGLVQLKDATLELRISIQGETDPDSYTIIYNETLGE